MPRQKLTPDEVRAFRERALDVAERLFEMDSDALSMRNLARELGCSPMTAYRYFEGLEELVAALRTRAFTHFARAQEAAIEGLDSPTARIACLARAYVDLALASPNAYRIMFDLRPPTRRYPELEEASRGAFAPLQQAVREAVELGALEGPAAQVAHSIWAQLHGLVTLSFADKLNFGLGLPELVDHLVRTIET